MDDRTQEILDRLDGPLEVHIYEGAEAHQDEPVRALVYSADAGEKYELDGEGETLRDAILSAMKPGIPDHLRR